MKYLISEGEENAWMPWKVYMVRAFAFVFMALFVVVGINGALEPVHKASVSKKLVLSKVNHAATSKELLNSTTVKDDYGEGEGGGDDNNNNQDGSMNRVGMDGQCSKDNILVYQGATTPLPNGIPTYTVDIQNVCLSGSCSISDIHMSCGWFSSARLINPKVFHRIEYDDCLVNDGEPLNPGDSLTFEYANSFKYPLSVTSVSC